MKARHGIALSALALTLATALSGCVDAECPAGSKSVQGSCMTIGADADSGDPGELGGADQLPPDSDLDAASPEGTPDAGGDVQVDAGPPPVPCSELECDEHATCSEATGTAVCTCDEGYRGDGESCADVDECEEDTHDCDPHAECQNEPGSYSCECEPGYEGDGKECEENPCEPRVNPCDSETTECRNDDGEAVCDCLEGRDRCDGDEHSCGTDLATDDEHCGACEAACAGNLACEGGECEQAIVQLSLGNLHSCGLAPDGEMLCWGKNQYGQLARDEDSTQPTYEPAPTKYGAARLMSADLEVTCAVLEDDDELVCFGQSGLTWLDVEGPLQGDFSLGSANDAEILEVGSLHASIVTDGSVQSWGLDNLGVLDSGNTLDFSDRVERLDDVEVLAGGRGDCAIDGDRRVLCWGNEVDTPTEIVDASDDPLEDARDVATSSYESTGCAVLESGRVMCWGFNENGQLGNVNVTVDDRGFAVPVTDEDGAPVTGMVEVAVGGDFACARHEEGRVFCWGRRDRLGGGTTGTGPQRYATEVSNIEDAVELVAGAWHACVRRRSGQVQCWGDNASGQLGVNPSGGGGITSSSTPVNVIGLP